MMSATVITWDEQERLVAPQIAALHTRIHEVHTSRFDLDQHLAGTGDWRRCAQDLEVLWSAIGFEGEGFHVSCFRERLV